MDRTNVLLMIERALEACFPEQKTAIVRELERRLPTDGRSHDGFLDGPPWWRTEEGRYLHIHDMDSEHLANVVALIRRSEGGWRKKFIKPIEAELMWRGKK